jgi:hypothetical protein
MKNCRATVIVGYLLYKVQYSIYLFTNEYNIFLTFSVERGLIKNLLD